MSQDDVEDDDGPKCPHCGTPFADLATHYGLDVRTGEGRAFVTFLPCCEGMQEAVALEGYEAAYGRRLVDVVRAITGQEVLHVEGDGDGSVVCRLRIKDPTVSGPRDSAGRAAAESPSGWRSEVFADVQKHHRHHDPPQGHKFSLAVYNGSVRVGVAVVGRPVSRELQTREPHTLEVTRVTTWGETPLRTNATSKLYGAAATRAKALGYTKLITYTLAGIESGASLVASGWVPTHVGRPGERTWDTPGRRRATTAPRTPKVRWERGLTKAVQRDIEARRSAEEAVPAVLAPVTRRVAVIACGARKRDVPSPARSLYTGSLFVAQRRDVEGRVPFWIVSGKWGILDPDTEVAPYNFRVNDIPRAERFAWGQRAAAQLAAALGTARLDGVLIELHAGAEYQKPLGPAFTAAGAVVEVLPPGRLQLGHRLQWYAQRRARPHSAAERVAEGLIDHVKRAGLPGVSARKIGEYFTAHRAEILAAIEAAGLHELAS